MKDLTQQIKDNSFYNANEKDLFIRDRSGNLHPAKIYGRLLDYPYICEDVPINQAPAHEAQISWGLVQRLAEGTINTVSI